MATQLPRTNEVNSSLQAACRSSHCSGQMLAWPVTRPVADMLRLRAWVPVLFSLAGGAEKPTVMGRAELGDLSLTATGSGLSSGGAGWCLAGWR